MTPLLLAAALSTPIIDVYTMGQGQHMFERFGHAAICVVRPNRPGDTRCYNYGTTDFGSPPEELGWKFLRGDAEFWVSVWPLERMLLAYRKSDRSIWRQRLDVPPEVAQKIAQRLEHDALPENRRYLYHHFRDNCSTRVRDVIDEASDDRLSRGTQAPVGASYRNLARRFLAGERIALWAGDLLVGRGADAPLLRRDAMFLPRYLREGLQSELGATPEVVYQRRGPDFPHEPASNVGITSALSLFVGGLAFAGRKWRPALAAVGILLSVLACLIWFVAVFSRVPELSVNELCLLLWPTDAALGFLSAERRRGYARLRLGVALAISLAWSLGVLRQPLLPFTLLVGLPMALAAFDRQISRASSTTDATA